MGYCLVHEVYVKGVALVQLSQHAWYLESFHLPTTCVDVLFIVLYLPHDNDVIMCSCLGLNSHCMLKLLRVQAVQLTVGPLHF